MAQTVIWLFYILEGFWIGFFSPLTIWWEVAARPGSLILSSLSIKLLHAAKIFPSFKDEGTCTQSVLHHCKYSWSVSADCIQSFNLQIVLFFPIVIVRYALFLRDMAQPGTYILYLAFLAKSYVDSLLLESSHTNKWMASCKTMFSGQK